MTLAGYVKEQALADKDMRVTYLIGSLNHYATLGWLSSLWEILGTNPPLDSRPFGNPVNPFHQMGECCHILFCDDGAELPSLDP